MNNSGTDEILHPGHHSVRLKGHDYTQRGFYFLTICSHKRKYIFASIREGKSVCSPLGVPIHECWLAVPLHFPRTQIREFVIMPNHIHGIIELIGEMGCSSAAPLREKPARPAVEAG